MEAVLASTLVRPVQAWRQTGSVHIRGLQARCIIGVRAWERKRRQRVVIDLAFESDLAPAAVRDDLREVVDYKRVKDQVLRHVQQSRHLLLEALASSVADLVLGDERIQAVDVTVEKPGALTSATSVAVRIQRQRAPSSSSAMEATGHAKEQA